MKLKFLIMILILALLVSGCTLTPATGDVTPAPTDLETIQPAATPSVWHDEGTFVVGTDILQANTF